MDVTVPTRTSADPDKSPEKVIDAPLNEDSRTTPESAMTLALSNVVPARDQISQEFSNRKVGTVNFCAKILE